MSELLALMFPNLAPNGRLVDPNNLRVKSVIRLRETNLAVMAPGTDLYMLIIWNPSLKCIMAGQFLLVVVNITSSAGNTILNFCLFFHCYCFFSNFVGSLLQARWVQRKSGSRKLEQVRNTIPYQQWIGVYSCMYGICIL